MLARIKSMIHYAKTKISWIAGEYSSLKYAIVTQCNPRVFKAQAIRNVHLDLPGVFKSIQSWTSELFKSNAATRILECYSKLHAEGGF